MGALGRQMSVRPWLCLLNVLYVVNAVSRSVYRVPEYGVPRTLARSPGLVSLLATRVSLEMEAFVGMGAVSTSNISD